MTCKFYTQRTWYRSVTDVILMYSRTVVASTEVGTMYFGYHVEYVLRYLKCLSISNFFLKTISIQINEEDQSKFKKLKITLKKLKPKFHVSIIVPHFFILFTLEVYFYNVSL